MGGWSKGACQAPAARQPRQLAPAPTAAAAAVAWPLPLPSTRLLLGRVRWAAPEPPSCANKARGRQPGSDPPALALPSRGSGLPSCRRPLHEVSCHLGCCCRGGGTLQLSACGRAGSQPERRGKGQGGEAFIWRLEQQPGFDCMPGTQLPVADKVSIAAALPQSRAEQSGASSSTCSTSTSNRMHQHATATAQHARRTQLCCRLAAPPLHQCGDSAELEARVATQGVGRRLPGCSSRQSAADSCSCAQRIAAPDRQERGCRRGADAGPCRQHLRHCRQHPHEFC